MWDERCRGNVSGDNGEGACQVRGHVERNRAKTCSVEETQREGRDDMEARMVHYGSH